MDEIKNKIISYLKDLSKEENITLEVPPKQELGDYAFPCFMLSKKLKKSPVTIAMEFEPKLTELLVDEVVVQATGPYLNFFVSKSKLAETVIEKVHKSMGDYGRQKDKKSLVLIESPGPNTNKPLHLGHLRNILIGKSMSNILNFTGHQTKIVNIVNDRGVHICKSMYAYEKFGENLTPEKVGIKPDHFVGDYYVKYAQMEKENPDLEKEVQNMLIKWEKGDKKTRELWKKMNKWALEGMNESYRKLGFKIDKEYYESELYLHGKEIILEGLKKGIFKKNAEGAIIFDLESKGLGTKVLLRSNGTSVYITQDIYMAKERYETFKFDEMIYVVGNEQEYHFKVLFEVFKALGYPFSDKCYHFSYGMIELPSGKMKSREGSIIDTDELIEDVIKTATFEVEKRYPDLDSSEIQRRAHAIGMGAMRFFILKVDPLRNFVFNLNEALSFDGETGPYVQYAYARICSIMRKNMEEGFGIDYDNINYGLLNTEYDRKVITALESFENIVLEAARSRTPAKIARYLLDLSAGFSEYYHTNQILKEDLALRNARLALIDCIRIVIGIGLKLLDIEALERM